MKRFLSNFGGALLIALTVLLALVVLAVTPATSGVRTYADAKGVATLALADIGRSAHRFMRMLVVQYAWRTAPVASVFQSTVALIQGFGVIGEIAFDGPYRGQPGVVKGTQANIQVGRAFTIDNTDGQFTVGGTGTGGFGGILMAPKTLLSVGTSGGGPLAPTMVVPVGEAAEFCTMGEIFVQLITTAAVGQGVYFVQADGTLGAGTAAGGQTQIAGASVKRYTNTGAGALAVISLTGP